MNDDEWLDQISEIVDQHIEELQKAGHTKESAVADTVEDVRYSMESLL